VDVGGNERDGKDKAEAQESGHSRIVSGVIG